MCKCFCLKSAPDRRNQRYNYKINDLTYLVMLVVCDVAFISSLSSKGVRESWWYDNWIWLCNAPAGNAKTGYGNVMYQLVIPKIYLIDQLHSKL